MVSERLKQFIDSQSVSVRQFEVNCGLKNGTLARLIRNGTSMTTDNLAKVLDHNPDLNADWLLTGEGSMLKSKEQWHEETMRKLEEEIEYHKRVNRKLMDLLDGQKKGE